MTGLDIGSDALIEIAALVTDSELRVLGEGVDVVVHTDEAKLTGMQEFVRDMHERSGLTEAVRASTVSIAEAERIVLYYVRQYIRKPHAAALAAISIAADRMFLA